MTRLESLGASGLGDPGQVGAQACAVLVFLVTVVPVTVLCGPVLFLPVSYPMPRGALTPAFPFLSTWSHSSQMEVSVCVSWYPVWP